MALIFLGTVGRGKVGRTQYVEYKTHTRGQDNDIYYSKIGATWSQLARQHATSNGTCWPGVPAGYHKVIVAIRQYGPTFATTHRGIQYDCGGGFP